jgi:hypothetical protein
VASTVTTVVVVASIPATADCPSSIIATWASRGRWVAARRRKPSHAARGCSTRRALALATGGPLASPCASAIETPRAPESPLLTSFKAAPLRGCAGNREGYRDGVERAGSAWRKRPPGYLAAATPPQIGRPDAPPGGPRTNCYGAGRSSKQRAAPGPTKYRSRPETG